MQSLLEKNFESERERKIKQVSAFHMQIKNISRADRTVVWNVQASPGRHWKGSWTFEAHDIPSFIRWPFLSFYWNPFFAEKGTPFHFDEETL